MHNYSEVLYKKGKAKVEIVIYLYRIPIIVTRSKTMIYYQDEIIIIRDLEVNDAYIITDEKIKQGVASKCR